MTERERLIELLKQVKDKCKNTKQCENCVGYGKGAECVDYLIADTLLANGVIVSPCKKGDTMYCDGKYFADHCEGEVMKFPVDIVRTEVCSTFRGEIDMIFDFNDFGKTVFLSREEAEKALAERSKG